MIEIPEASVLANQINELLTGKSVYEVIANQSPHKFAWYNGEPNHYNNFLKGKTVDRAINFGGMVEIFIDDMRLLICDGVSLRLYKQDEKIPKKHQLLIKFDDGSFLVATIQMYGGLWCYKNGQFDNPYYLIAKQKTSPLKDDFNLTYFYNLLSDEEVQVKSTKEFLATKQRIPGLGNGVLQDILFNAKIHPKRKINTLTDEDKNNLFQSIKNTLFDMTIQGGRDTEKDLFGCYGGYKTKVSKNTVNKPCQICGGNIIKKSYMGGSIYYCEVCQKEI